MTGWRVDRRGGGWTDGVEGGYDRLEGGQTGWRVDITGWRLDRRGGGWTDGVDEGYDELEDGYDRLEG